MRWELLYGFGASLWGRSVSFKVRYWELLPFIACSVLCSHPLGAPGASQHLRHLQTLEMLPKCPVLPLLPLQQGTSWTLSPWGQRTHCCRCGDPRRPPRPGWERRHRCVFSQVSTTFPALILANPSHPLERESNPLLLKTGTLFLARMPHFPCYPWVSWPRAAPGTSQGPSVRLPAGRRAVRGNVGAPSPYGPHRKLDLPCPSQGTGGPKRSQCIPGVNEGTWEKSWDEAVSADWFSS